MYSNIDPPGVVVRNRCFITLLIIAIIRMGAVIPIPGISQYELFEYVQKNPLTNNPLTSIISDNNNYAISIFAFNIYPYINGSIILQLAGSFIPDLAEKQKDGELYNRKEVTLYQRILTIGIALIQSINLAFYLKKILFNWNWFLVGNTILWLTIGCFIILWLCERITIYGIGNGFSLLIFTNLMSNFIRFTQQTYSENLKSFIVIFIILYLIILTLVIIQQCEKRIPIISAKLFGDPLLTNPLYKLNYLPLKISQSGIMPLVLATSFLLLPGSILVNLNLIGFLNENLAKIDIFSNPTFLTFLKTAYSLFYFGLIFVFDSFYSNIILNPKDLAKQLQTASVSIPNIRSGRQTGFYIKQTKTRINFMGTFLLSILTIIPNLVEVTLKISTFKMFGVSSLIILVGIFLDIFYEIDGLFNR